jgi:hypothetical protein
MKFCKSEIVAKTVECFWATSLPEISNYYQENSCTALVKTKLNIYDSIAYDILKLNKAQVAIDEKKKNTQARRWKYDSLLEIIMVNIWYMERIWKKWPSKTPDAYK